MTAKLRLRAVSAGLGMVLAASAAQGQDMAMGQAQLVRNLLPTVVNITARTKVAESNPVQASSTSKAAAGFSVQTAAGSGFIIEPSGQIATNWHVVNGAFEIIVTFSDGSRAKAEVLNASPLVDLAVVKVNAGHKLQAVQWADSAKVQVGDPVLAIGNPLGIGMSVSGGLVSALNRNIMDTAYDDFIQTDAAINHGNSGGPLFDLKGQVIGVNSAIVSPTSANAGLGFAMPSNDARFIFDRLTRKVFTRPGFIGTKLQPVSPEMAQAVGMSEPSGSIVAAVEDGSPAALAGLRPSDIVLRFGAETPSDERALRRAIARTDPGTTVPLGVFRDGKTIEVPVKVEEWPVMWWEDPKAADVPHISIPADLGLSLSPLTDKLRASYEILPDAHGVLVTGVLPGTDAAVRGLSPGDVIEQVGKTSVQTPDDVSREIGAARVEKRGFALFLVMRKHQNVTPAQEPGPGWMVLQLPPA